MTNKKTSLKTETPLTAAARNVGRPPSKVPLMLSTSLALLGGLGYVQRAYAGSLSASNSETVKLYGPGTFETQSGFSVDVTSGDAITIETDPGHAPDPTDATTFRDYSGGTIASSLNDGINTRQYYGSLSITTNSTLNVGAFGVDAQLGGLASQNTSNESHLSISTSSVAGENGVRAENYGVGNLEITVSGDILATDGQGIRAKSQNYVTESRSISITAAGITSDEAGVSVLSRGGEQVSISITVSGDISAGNGGYGYGVWALADQLNGDADIQINTYGSISAYSDGIYVKNGNALGGDISITSTGDITVTGAYYSGVNATNGGENLTIVVGNVSGHYHGVNANNNASGSLTIISDGHISNTYQDGSGIYAFAAQGQGSITVNDVSGQRHGVYFFQGDDTASISVNGAVTGGNGGYGDGIFLYSGGGVTITINDGGSVSTGGTDTSDFAIEAGAFNGPVIINNAGTVTGRVNLTNSNLFTNTGTWNLAGTTSNFNATGDSAVANAGLIIAAQDAAVDETSVIENLDTFRNNAGGTIRLADGNAADVFEIRGGSGTGNFIANGGTVELDVVLGGDGSATDRLEISGNVILDGAPTALAFTSIGGGTGGETTTGIEVVTVGGSSDAGAFVLAGPVEVGALTYDLSLGQCDDTASANWYLCSAGTIGTTGAVFEAMPGVVLNTFARSETLQQRLGARVQGAGATGTLSTKGDADLPVAQAVGPWMRTWGDFAEITPDRSSAGTRWEADSWGFEAGIGTILGDHAGGNLVGGVNLRYSATYADLSNPVGTASLNSEGFGAAASLTWFGNDGFYVDGNAAMDFVSIDATSQGGGELLDDYDDVVYSASAEVGKRIELQGGTTVVPQAQLSWGKMRDGTLTDNLGNVVSFADRETLTSRVGLTVEQDVTDTTWGSGKVFGFANVLNDLSGSRTATVAGTDVTQSGTGDWLELGGGFSLQPTESTNLFGQVSYREAFNGVDGDAIAVSAGWRMQW